ncbi:2'-5' RNA ligase family protein [Hydrogenophaga sp.]|uniref:2'-5' RNA ligase family protein n=1 Tax=Hydrogenophaga sp. TaxID=1904254 RepID=UPI0025C691CF|nr:2'-5' RNA ligase family protein [Hydrogenophaga sp.]MBT9464642.1 2'-5' RNA ligase family protein [Hydrogenophaga sp.]
MPHRHDIYFLLYPTPAAACCAAVLWDATRLRCAVKSFPMPPERLHITLLPLGRFEDWIPDRVLEQAQAAGAAVDDEPFDVVFNALRSRSGAPIGTVELAGGGPALRKLYRLQRDLRERLIRVGFPADQLRTGFTPHMTLDYKHPRVAPRSFETPVAWRVTELCLVDSLHGRGRHEVLARWPLRERQQVFSGWETDFSIDFRRA